MSSASGTDAAEVLACRSTVITTFSGGSPSFLRGRIEDPGVGLVRNDPVDIRGIEADLGKHFAEDLGEIDDGVAENFAALHSQLADGAGGRRAAVDEQQVVVAAVGVKPGAENAAFRSPWP